MVYAILKGEGGKAYHRIETNSSKRVAYLSMFPSAKRSTQSNLLEKKQIIQIIRKKIIIKADPSGKELHRPKTMLKTKNKFLRSVSKKFIHSTISN